MHSCFASPGKLKWATGVARGLLGQEEGSGQEGGGRAQVCRGHGGREEEEQRGEEERGRRRGTTTTHNTQQTAQNTEQ